MNAPDNSTTAPPSDPPSGLADEPTSNTRWWIAVGVALVFLIGAVGYVIGTRTTQASDDLNAADVGFLQDMIDHHDQAVVLSILANANATDPIVKDFAMENIIFQRYQIGQMVELLANDGLGRGETDREVMTWMDMGVPLAEMPGLATQEEVDALSAATGDEANRLFLELMRDHHAGGIHMGEYAMEHASSPRVRALAQLMVENQTVEVREYTQLMERLGYE